MTTSIATTASSLPGSNARRRRRASARSFRPASPTAASLHGLLTNKKAMAGAAILFVFIALALLAPVLFPGQPVQDHRHGLAGADAEYWLGTTAKGQDVLALTIHGSRSSLFVGPDRGLRLHLHRHPGGPRLGLLRQVHRRSTVPDDQRLPAPARAAAPGHPGRVPAAGPGHRDPGPGGHRLGRLRPGAALTGAVHPLQGLCGRGRGHRRTAAAGSCSAKSCRTWPPS